MQFSQPQRPVQQISDPPQQSIQYQPASNFPPAKSSKKKIITILLAVLAILLIGIVLVSSLSQNSGKNITNSDEIVWWGTWEDERIINPLIEEYSAQTGVKIVFQRQAKEDYRERLANSLAQGKGPDIFRIHNTWVPMFYSYLSALPSNVMSSEEYEQTFYRAALDASSTKNGIVAIPLEIDGLALFINQDLFTTFGVPTPTSWNELRDAANRLTIRDRDRLTQAGIALGSVNNVDNWEEIIALMLVQNNANLSEPSDPNATGVYSYYFNFRDQYFAWDETFPSSITAFATGKAAMIIAPASSSYEIRKINPGLKFRVVPVPQLPKFDESEPDVTYASFWVEGVWNKSKNSQAAWEFLKYLSQKEQIAKLQKNQSASSLVKKGISPRLDMRESELLDPNIAGFVRIAPTARVWYLASNTGDGQTGLNTLLSSAFKASLGDSRDISRGNFSEMGLQIRTILAQYGLAAPPPPPEE